MNEWTKRSEVTDVGWLNTNVTKVNLSQLKIDMEVILLIAYIENSF